MGPITKDGKPDGNIDDKKIAETVDELLPAFEDMLRYRNTILKVKEIELENEIEIMGATKQSKVSSLKKNLREVQELKVPRAWANK